MIFLSKKYLGYRFLSFKRTAFHAQLIGWKTHLQQLDLAEKDSTERIDKT